MKSLKTKVIMSAIVLVFALIATIGSTYAWFTVSNTVTASFNVEVQSAESLLIKPWQSGDPSEDEGTGANGSTYTDLGFTLAQFKSTVTLGSGGYYDDLNTWDLYPVTCLAGETINQTNYSSIDITALRYLTSPTAVASRPLAAATSNTATTGHFIELEFWLLRTSGGTGTALEVSLTPTVTGDFPEAVFIGVLGDVVGSTPGTNDEQFLFGNDLDFGFAWGVSDAGYDTLNPTYNSASGWDGAPGGVLDDALTAFGGAGDPVLYLQEADVPELITVRIWIEGWDADTTNLIMASTMNIVLTFTLA